MKGDVGGGGVEAQNGSQPPFLLCRVLPAATLSYNHE